MSFRPLFVLGLARSGTNLLARMLDRHPLITVALDPLLPLFRSLRNAIVSTHGAPAVRARFDANAPFQDFYFASDGPTLLDCILDGSAALTVADEDLIQLRDSVAARAALESPVLAARMGSLTGSDHRAALEDALRIVSTTKPGAHWVGAKEVWVFEFVPLLARAFPAARFYAIERDPRAIVASLVAMAERDPTQAAHPPSYMRHWRKSIALSRRFAADPALRERFRAVPYEHLVADPDAEARRICAELEVKFEPAMLDLSAEGWAGNSSYAHSKRGVYASSAARWRRDLAAEVIHTTDFLCGPEMALTGYRPEDAAGLDETVLGYLERAGREPGSWRSDSGDPVLDLGGELLRHVLLDNNGGTDSGLVRRCFLFTETFEAIRSAHSGDGKAEQEAGRRR
jgi:hypothetical protein